MNESKVLALIPARSGSKSVPDKNIRDFDGKPLLAHSIEQALAARRVDRVIVSTDSEPYAAIARSYGAETPFLRPAEFAGDEATDLVVFVHALTWLQQQEGWEPEVVVHLRPTYPRRDPADIDRAVDILLADPTLDSVRSVAPAPETPFKMWLRGADGLLVPVADLGNEAYNQPRQALPPVFLQNACIDVVRSRVILEQQSMTGKRIFGYVMSDNIDIDTFADLERARSGGPGPGRTRSFCLDLDSVLAHRSDDALRPRLDVIAAVNRLAAAGCRVIIQVGERSPARRGDVGSLLARWGVQHHAVVSGGLDADFLVDGRAIGIDTFLSVAASLAPEQDRPISKSEEP